ncbi:MFS transporter [Pseudonocardia ailaonensis]|uniref:MFS transporter n=1 Tax=Pseudonocardia ailaonensis TaxID=367279 RepID=A0ABN2MH93_9PSEU
MRNTSAGGPADNSPAAGPAEDPTGRPAGIRSILLGSSIGTMLEYYDFFVYVALTATLSALFFPAGNPVAATLLGAATFGVSYLARPVGTLIFSPMADRIGRKKTFVATLAVMGAATTAIGLLPTYATIGVAAPVLLVVLRIVQGIGLGGEYSAAVVYVVEQAPAARRGRYTSVLQGTASVGLLVALLLVLVLRLALGDEAFASWGWRVPFLVSAAVVAVATVVRLRMRETPVFDEMRRSGTLSKSPVAETFTTRSSWKSLLLATFGAQGGTSVTLYTSIIYMLYFLGDVLKVPASTANLVLGAGILVGAPCYPLFGALSDRIGRARVMLIGIVAWMVVVYPVFAGIRAAATGESWVVVAALIAVLAVLTAMVMAPLPAFISECFPPRIRTTGFGAAQQLGNILFGGFLPLISLSLVAATGNQLAGVGYSIASLLPCVLVTWLWALRRESRMRTAAAQPDPARAVGV